MTMGCMTLDQPFNLFGHWGWSKGHNDVLIDQYLLGTSAYSPLVPYTFYILSHALLKELTHGGCMTQHIGLPQGFWLLGLMSTDCRAKPSTW